MLDSPSLGGRRGLLGRQRFVNCIHRKTPKRRPMPGITRRASNAKSKTRSRVEHVFAEQNANGPFRTHHRDRQGGDELRIVPNTLWNAAKAGQNELMSRYQAQIGLAKKSMKRGLAQNVAVKATHLPSRLPSGSGGFRTANELGCGRCGRGRRWYIRPHRLG